MHKGASNRHDPKLNRARFLGVSDKFQQPAATLKDVATEQEKARAAALTAAVDERMKAWSDGDGAAASEEARKAQLTLYDADKFVIRPFTVRRQCAFVEMVARGAQSPRWFVSHWWGESVVDFVACIEQHAQDYGKDDDRMVVKGGITEETPYWVCVRRAAARARALLLRSRQRPPPARAGVRKQPVGAGGRADG